MHPGEASTSQLHLGGLGGDSNHPNGYPVGEIHFVAQGNPEPARFCIVPKRAPVGEFAQQYFMQICKLDKPKVLISVTGGAQGFKMLSSKLEQVFNRGLIRAAQNSKAWVVTGGLNTGVMQLIGDAVRDKDVNVPCIGVATFSKVSHFDRLANGGTIHYSPEKPNDNNGAALNPDHTHFVLVESEVNQWGEEIKFRSDLEDFISREWRIPLVLVAVNGGPGTLQTVAEGVSKRFPTSIVDGSGRACDAMAAYLKNAADPKSYPKRDAWDALISPLKPPDVQKYTTYMEQIRGNKEYVTIFNPNEEATTDMDKTILRSILMVHENSGFAQKLALGVDWGRADLILELLEKDDTSLSTEQKTTALNVALQKALKFDKAEIFELLVNKGADKASVDLSKLYNLEDSKWFIERLKPFAGLSNVNRVEFAAGTEVSPLLTESSPLNASTSRFDSLRRNSFKRKNDDNVLRHVKHILDAFSPMYGNLLVDGKVTFTDILVWAILCERVELAKAIWRHCVLPVHSALVACHLYSVFQDWFEGEEKYEENFKWFEKEAIAVISEMEYEYAKRVLEWQWKELNDKNALELSEMAECKDFYAISTVQRYLDEKLYSDERGAIPPGTKMWRVLLLILFPFLIPNSGYYEYNDEGEDGVKTHFYHFYNLPVIKFLTSTVLYIGFLILLGVNCVLAAPCTTTDSSGEAEISDNCDYSIKSHEYFLWVWIAASIVEELAQFMEDSEGYFSLLTNQMDLTMYFQLVAYIILRILAWQFQAEAFYEAYIDVLIIATIICYVRLANVFAFSKSLGPLFFVIIRLFNDVWQWLFIFFLFGVSFQLAIFALTRQAGQDPWIGYPAGTLGVGFSTVVGDTGDNTMDWMSNTHIGVYMISLYALIVQVMLVNLLIAMMGDTYGSVKENSDKEWKFYRYGLVTDYVTSSPYPPPFNLIFGPIFTVKQKLEEWKTRAALRPLHIPLRSEDEPIDREVDPNTKTITKMKNAREMVLERERDEELDTLHSVSSVVREHMRLLNAQRDSDRLYLEYNMKSLEQNITMLKAQLDQIAARIDPALAPPQKQ